MELITDNIKQDLERLTKAERKIYDSVRATFSASSHEAAMDVALRGGVSWQYYPS